MKTNYKTLAMAISLFGLSQAHALEAAQTVSNAATPGRSAETISAEMKALSKRMAELARELRQNGGGGGDSTTTVFRVAEDGSVDTVDHVGHVERLGNLPGLDPLKPGARLGLVLMSASDGGVSIAAVTPGSGADKAGIKAGDELISVRGKALPAAGALQAAREILQTLKADEQLALGVMRAKQPLSFTVTASNLPKVMIVRNLDQLGELHGLSPEIQAEVSSAIETAMQARDYSSSGDGKTRQVIRIRLPGSANNSDLDMTTLNPDLAQYFGAREGVLALDVKGYPPMLAGDVITRIDGVTIKTPNEVFTAFGKKAGQNAQVEVIRQKSNRTLSVLVPSHVVPPIPPVPPVPPAPPAPPAPPRG